MHWHDLLAIVCGGIFLLLVAGSVIRPWQRAQNVVPLVGRLQEARLWLEANGYRVTHLCPRAEWIGYSDSQEYRKWLTADFIVRQGPRYYAAVVVNDAVLEMNGLRLRDTWYPLYVAFQVNGILQIDIHRGEVHVIDFELNTPRYVIWRRVVNRTMWLLSGIVMALAWLYRG